MVCEVVPILSLATFFNYNQIHVYTCMHNYLPGYSNGCERSLVVLLLLSSTPLVDPHLKVVVTAVGGNKNRHTKCSASATSSMCEAHCPSLLILERYSSHSSSVSTNCDR